MRAAVTMSLKPARVHPGTNVAGPLAEFVECPVLMRCSGIEKIRATGRTQKSAEACFRLRLNRAGNGGMGSGERIVPWCEGWRYQPELMPKLSS